MINLADGRHERAGCVDGRCPDKSMSDPSGRGNGVMTHGVAGGLSRNATSGLRAR
jgi:hypothetical protein